MENLPLDIIYCIANFIDTKYLHTFIKVNRDFQNIVYTDNKILLKLMLYESFIKKLIYLEETMNKYRDEKNIDLDIFSEIYDVYKPYYENKIDNIDNN